MILKIEPISENEPDGVRLPEMVASVMKHHETGPKYVTTDAAYDYGRYRTRLKGQSFELMSLSQPPPILSGYSTMVRLYMCLKKIRYNVSMERSHTESPRQ
ncbi:hypothetical protein C8Z91_34870 [Paenibacillus elgii]|uniref:Uncharacterized protein n=1 Tax=Paenibacillus elgii TaxID=189691 RepID=A0A2T6FRW7_9BACL|nr:hypothetical protein C8Z91_34870 [Paenibacillus elgii]